jgi:hypothetical protein
VCHPCHATLVAVLPRGVPDPERDRAPRAGLERLGAECGADGRLVPRREPVVQKPVHEAGLADRGLPKQHGLDVHLARSAPAAAHFIFLWGFFF